MAITSSSQLSASIIGLRNQDGSGEKRTAAVAAAVLLRLAALLRTGRQSHLSSDFEPGEVSQRRYELAPLIVFGPTKSMTVTPPHSRERQNVSHRRHHFKAIYRSDFISSNL